MPTRSPIVLLGNNRSGTTLVRLLLIAHPDIAIPPESHFFLWLHDKYSDWCAEHGYDGFLSDLLKCTKIETWDIDVPQLDHWLRTRTPRSYAELVAAVYEYYAWRIGKPHARWGDKNSLWVEKLPVIHSVYPDAAFLHIVRDGRDVASSYLILAQRRLANRYAPRLPQRIDDIASIWSNNVRAVRNFGRELPPNKFFEVRYEDILMAPEASLSRVFRFLGMQFHPDVMEYGATGRNVEHEPREFLAWKEKLGSPIDPSNIGKYRTTLSSFQVHRFEQLARHELAHYRYL